MLYNHFASLSCHFSTRGFHSHFERSFWPYSPATPRPWTLDLTLGNQFSNSAMEQSHTSKIYCFEIHFENMTLVAAVSALTDSV